MTDRLLDLEPAIRLGSFAAVFAVIALWEVLAPRRAQAIGRWQRWPANLGIVLLNTMLLRVLFPTAAVGVAVAASSSGAGLLNVLTLPPWLAVVVAVVLLDLAIYLQHVVFHFVPLLWRLHRMHHADLEFDVTTGARFHPIEIVLSMLIKFAVIVAVGASPVAVLIFEVALNATAMFNHGNIYLPPAIDRVLRWLVVTPDMHRVHHSVVPQETNSNFGFNLPWWDRALGTYRPAPAAGQLAMQIGLEQFRDPTALRLVRMLLQPFAPTRPELPEVSWIDPSALAQRLARDPPIALLDVRGEAEFRGEFGHLANARNIPLVELTARIGELDEWRSRPVVTVCLTQIRSAKAVPVLQSAGFSNVAVLRGGMQQWVKEGLPVEREPANPD